MGDSSDITTKPIEATRHYTVVHVMHSTSSIHCLVSTNTAHVVNIKWFTYIQYCAASPRCVDWFGTTLWNELNWITDGCELHNFTHYFSCSHLPLLLHFIHQGRWFRVCMWFVNHSTYARLSGESWSGNLSLGDLKQTWGSPFYICMSTSNSTSAPFHKTIQHKTLSHHQVADGDPRWPHGAAEWQCTGQFRTKFSMLISCWWSVDDLASQSQECCDVIPALWM